MSWSLLAAQPIRRSCARDGDTSRMSRSEAIEALARRYHDVQGTDIDKARKLAEAVAEHEALLLAASAWMATGVFPNQPEVEGWTPAQLAGVGAPPTMVFSLLGGLYDHPAETHEYIAHDLLSHLDRHGDDRVSRQ